MFQEYCSPVWLSISRSRTSPLTRERGSVPDWMTANDPSVYVTEAAVQALKQIDAVAEKHVELK